MELGEKSIKGPLEHTENESNCKRFLNFEKIATLAHMNPLIPFEQDPLVEAADYGFLTEPMYFRQGLSSRSDCLIRRTVAEHLVEARRQLPPGYNFKIWDGYRPTSVQRALYEGYQNTVRATHPNWSPEQVRNATEEFVSPPTQDPTRAAPHNTGGTVDLTLVDAFGRELDMGTGFDHFDVEAHTAHYAHGQPGTREALVHHNRMLLHDTLIALKFYNFPTEWWHYEYGTAHWAKWYEQAILYGGCEI